MLEAKREPTIVCCDLWQRGTLTQVKMAAYKRLIDDGMIRIRRVVHYKATGITVVDYWSQLPHAWTLQHLKRIAELLDPGQQMKLEAIP